MGSSAWPYLSLANIVSLPFPSQVVKLLSCRITLHYHPQKHPKNARNTYSSPVPPGVNGPPPPFVSELANFLDAPVLSCDLRSKDVGTFEFGKIDDSKFKGPLTYVNIDSSQGAWKIDSMFFTIDGKPTSASAGTSMILDTDGNTMSLDTAVVKNYYSKVEGSKDVSGKGDASAWTVPCKSKMPDLGINFGSVSSQTNNTAVVPGSIIMGSPVDFSGSKSFCPHA